MKRFRLMKLPAMLMLLASVLTPASVMASGNAKTGFIDKIYKGAATGSKYVLFVPKDYDKKNTHP